MPRAHRRDVARNVSTTGHRGNSRPILIAIDGPAGSGKSTTARRLAERLGLPYIDTGAMYRAVTLKAMREGVPLEEGKRLASVARRAKIRFSGPVTKQRVFLDGRDVSRAIREPELTKLVYFAAKEPLVRHELVKIQRRLGARAGGVMEGRDIGTVVFPHADFKFFFTANEAIRARRRYRELKAAGKPATLKGVLKDMRVRDRSDRERKQSPLCKARDARLIDTSELTIDETVDKIIPLLGLKSFRGRWLSE